MDEHKEAVRAMQDYIRDHIQDEITLADLAAASSFSPWYARRLFMEHLNMNAGSLYQTLETVEVGLAPKRRKYIRPRCRHQHGIRKC